MGNLIVYPGTFDPAATGTKKYYTPSSSASGLTATSLAPNPSNTFNSGSTSYTWGSTPHSQDAALASNAGLAWTFGFTVAANYAATVAGLSMTTFRQNGNTAGNSLIPVIEYQVNGGSWSSPITYSTITESIGGGSSDNFTFDFSGESVLQSLVAADVVTFRVFLYNLTTTGDEAFDAIGQSGTTLTGTTTLTLTKGIALSDVPNNRVVQRDAGATSKSLTVSGTYVASGADAGYLPVIQAKVTNASGGATVADWTTLTGFTASGGNWSGKLTVPQGAWYNLQVRDANDNTLTSVGTNAWGVGGVVLCYGQSNTVYFTSRASVSPPAADPLTRYFDGSTWGVVPIADGVRTSLNTLATATGIPWGSLNAAVSGTALGNLTPGNTSYDNMISMLDASGGDAEVIFWDQGEGDADAALHPTRSGYKRTLRALHDAMVAHMGRSATQCPMLLAGLGTTNATYTKGEDRWQAVKEALNDIAKDRPGEFYYSHSNYDLLRLDEYHYDGVGQGKQGARWAQTTLKVLGLATAEPHWHISGASVTSATTTTVSLVHSMGTDFTLGTDGWDVSGDGGATWTGVTPSKVNSTTILLTHAAIPSSSLRRVRYQYGTQHIVAANTVGNYTYDNSSLNIPLNYTVRDVVCSGGTTLATFVRTDDGEMNGNALKVQSATMVPIGTISGARYALFMMIGNAGYGHNSPVLTVTPNSGTAYTASLLLRHDATGIMLFGFVLPPAEETATYLDLSLDYGTGTIELYGVTEFVSFVAPVSLLKSVTPTVVPASTATSATTATLSIPTGSNDYVIAITSSSSSASTVSVTSPLTLRFQDEFHDRIGVADLTGASAGAVSMSPTWDVSGTIGIAALTFSSPPPTTVGTVVTSSGVLLAGLLPVVSGTYGVTSGT